jgi:dihydroorotate dehydrogenase (fumarate)
MAMTTTSYLGLPLAHPFVLGASPLTASLDQVRRAVDGGCAAIVMHSLFEEQIERECEATLKTLSSHNDGDAEARSYFPEPGDFALGPETYLEQIHRIKTAVQIPLIASLNGVTAAGWLSCARLIEQAGADALELNVYHLPTRTEDSAADVEDGLLEVVRVVRSAVHLPLAVKLSPFFSALPHLARSLTRAGASGLVLFNRFYQPDIDPETLETHATLHLSDSSELLLRLRWLAILHGRLPLSLAASGGVHEPIDAVRAVMAGADAVQLVSALLLNGPGHLARVLAGLAEWLEQHEYGSLAELRGSMSLLHCPDPAAFERGNYMRILQSWRPEHPAGGWP